jgi:hypothetical protein
MAAASLLAGATVYVATLFAYAFTVPSCVANHAGFAFAGPGFITGAVGGLLTFAIGARNALRTWQRPAEVGNQMMKLLRVSGVAVVVSYVAAFVLFGAVFHIFKHECHLTPWSP